MKTPRLPATKPNPYPSSEPHDPDQVPSITAQDRANAEYRSSYKEWMSTMTPAQVSALAELGLHEPLISYSVGGHSPDAKADIAESPRAAVEPAPYAEADTPTTPTTTAATHEALSRLVSLLLLSTNLKLDAYALAFAVNLDALNGIGTQGEVAAKLGLSATIVSRRTEHMRQLLNLPYSPHQKGIKARTAASRSLKADHWRNRKTKSK